MREEDAKLMKKRKLFAAATVCVTIALSACGSQTEASNTATPSSVASESVTPASISADIKSLDTKRPDNLGSVRLAEYKDLMVNVPAQLKVTDEDVDEQIKTDLIEHRTSADTVERGDYVTIDFVGKIDGKAFENGSADSYTVEVGQNTLIDGFEDGLIGMKQGETKDLHLTFPTDYYDKECAGKNVVFTVTVKSIERTPELTDELAKDLDPECDSADEYRTKTKNNMTIYRDESYAQEKGYQALYEIEKLSDVEASDDAIEWAENLLITDYYVPAYDEYGDKSLADTLAEQNMSLSDFKDSLYDAASALVKDLLVTDAIAEKEGIEVTDAIREEYASTIGTTADKLANAFGKEYTDINVKEYAVFKALNDICVFTYTTTK